MKKILSIAGLDPSGGAGVLADIRTFEAFGLYPLGVVSALTIQNTKGVFGVKAVDSKIVKEQILSLLEDIEIDSIKIGLIPNKEVAKAIEKGLRDFKGVVVLDTPLISSSGFDMVEEGCIDALKRLFRLSTLITPNIKEAEIFVGFDIKSLEDIKRAALRLQELGANAVLITGGDFKDGAVDVLYDGEFEIFKKERLDSPNTHGTGCVFSSAIASCLSEKKSLSDCVKEAKEFVYDAIRDGFGIGAGAGVLNIRSKNAR